MAIESDVLVVGGGLAGLTSALSAAREGADVRLVSYKQSTLRNASGLVDVLGYPPGEDAPLADPFDALADLPAGHPYERVGVGAVREGLALFDGVAGDAYRGEHTDRNALVPVQGGSVKPTARYPASVAPGLASDERDALLVGFESLTGFDAPVAAAHLDGIVPFAATGATVAFPGDVRADATRTRFARALDRDENAEGTGVRAALAERVRSRLADSDAGRVGFPALLGTDEPRAVRESLTDALDVPVFEVPTGPPSVPGRRLEARLHAALDDAGVRVTTGNPAVDYRTEGGAVAAVIVDRDGTLVPYRAGEVVLATGGLVGKGIETDRDAVSEPIFGCHVPHPADRYDWFDEAPFGEHAFARFGVDVDRELRPRDADGAVEFPNLRAAGAVLGGADFAAEKSGSGISVATGYAAGTAAGESA